MSKLRISLQAISNNYQTLQQQLGATECGATVKANAYGLGAQEISKTLFAQGCKKFFAATLDEAIELRQVLPKAEIFVFHGVHKGEAETFFEYNLYPIINNPSQLEVWPEDEPIILHVDTGMTRIGFSEDDLDYVGDRQVAILMSHLACAESPDHQKNYEQLMAYDRLCKIWPEALRSFSNSYGIFLGTKFHSNIARPGRALYGGNPTPRQANPMQNVVRLSAEILQINHIHKPSTVGYGATYSAKPGQVIATVPIGYADGLSRRLSNKGKCYIGGQECPIVGRVSMDLVTVDITNIPENFYKLGQEVEFINDKYTISDIAKDVGTIDYEILTRLGGRVEKIYV